MASSSGEALIGASCPTRATEAETAELLAGSKSSNAANWTVADLAWTPGAAAPTAVRKAAKPRTQPASRPDMPAVAAAPVAMNREAEAAARRRAEEEAAAAQLRALNASHAQAAEAQRRKV